MKTRRIQSPIYLLLLLLGVITVALFFLGACRKQPNPKGSLCFSEIDHANLLVYYTPDGKTRPVKTVKDWEIRRRQILAGMQEAMGPLPKTDFPLQDERIEETVQMDGFKRIKLSFLVEPGHRLHSYLFVPTDLKAGEKRAAVLALHPTWPLGKGDTAGLSGRKNRSYGLELAQRGYVVMVPDYPSFGEDSTYNFDTDRYISGTMKGIYNHIRCVDYLCSLSYVDSSRIGVIGHSLGGHNAMFVGVFDPRLKVIVSSCGWTPFHNYKGGNIAGWTSKRYMPLLKTRYHLDPDKVPFDFYEIVAALAPRAFYSNSPLRDSNFDVNGVKKAIPIARKIYELYGVPDNLQVRYPDCEHDFPPEIRRDAYRFMDKVLQHTPARNVLLR